MLLALVLVTLHGTGRAGLGDGVQENSTPSDVDIALSQCRGKFQLRRRSVYLLLENIGNVSLEAYPCRMLIGLQGKVKHLASLIALLVHQLVADSQKSREACLDDLIKVLSVVGIGRLIAEGTADGK